MRISHEAVFQALVKQTKYVNTVLSTAFHGVFLVDTDKNADELHQVMSKEISRDGQLLIARLQGDFSGWDNFRYERVQERTLSSQ